MSQDQDLDINSQDQDQDTNSQDQITNSQDPDKTKTPTLKTKTPHSQHSHYFCVGNACKNHFNNLPHSDTIDTISQFR